MRTRLRTDILFGIVDPVGHDPVVALQPPRLHRQQYRPSNWPQPTRRLLEPIGTDSWQTYEDCDYGFRLLHPPAWSYKQMAMSGPGMPDDWPVISAVVFYPDSMAEALNHEGPPDPNAPNVVPPFSIEVYVGPQAEFRRAYPEPGATETIDVNGRHSSPRAGHV